MPTQEESDDYDHSERMEKIERAVEQARTNPDANPHPDYIAYVRQYPETNAADTFLLLAEQGALEGYVGSAGTFEKRLWDGGADEARGFADSGNKERLRELATGQEESTGVEELV